MAIHLDKTKVMTMGGTRTLNVELDGKTLVQSINLCTYIQR